MLTHPCMEGQFLVARAISAEASAPQSLSSAASRALGSAASQGAVSGWPTRCHGIFIWRRFHMPRLEWK